MFEIGPYTDADDLALYELTELFEGAFRRHTAPGTFEGRRRNFAQDLRHPGSRVARMDGRAVGFGTMTRVGGNLRRLIAIKQRRDPSMARWYRLLGRGWLLSAMAVSPLCRRQGIGTALAESRLAYARATRASSVFVTCIAGSGSADLYAGLGFAPILSVHPYYSDGSDMVMLGLRL